jgi:hypothetical protein
VIKNPLQKGAMQTGSVGQVDERGFLMTVAVIAVIGIAIVLGRSLGWL